MIVYGHGFLNNTINNLPVELHIPGYQYCGPGTHLEKRIARGDSGINPLDAACKEHDIAYEKHKDIEKRHLADHILQEKAWQRVKSSNASFGEKVAAWTVTNAMKAKRKFGMGNPFRAAVKNARNTLKKSKVKDQKRAIKIALKAARQSMKNKKI